MPLKKKKGRSGLRKALAGFAGGASDALLLQALLGEEQDPLDAVDEQIEAFPTPQLQLHQTPLPENLPGSTPGLLEQDEFAGMSLEEILAILRSRGQGR